MVEIEVGDLPRAARSGPVEHVFEELFDLGARARIDLPVHFGARKDAARRDGHTCRRARACVDIPGGLDLLGAETATRTSLATGEHRGVELATDDAVLDAIGQVAGLERRLMQQFEVRWRENRFTF